MLIIFRRVRIAFNQRVSAEYHTWRAVPALDSARVNKSFLYRVQFTRSAKAFYGGQRAATNLGGQCHTTWAWYTINQYSTGTTFPVPTPMLYPIITLSTHDPP